MQDNAVALRPTVSTDGADIWRLVRASRVLDVNSEYCYLLLCEHFSGTCAVAESGGEVVGFVTAYRPPGREDTLFIWQVGTSAQRRGEGIATRLIREVLDRDGCHGVRFLEATVGPSNHASRALFQGLAQRLKTDVTEQAFFDSAMFADRKHEPENLLRIGPF